MGERMRALLKNRTVLIALGLVLLALLIWFAGPYFAFADRKPLESAVARLILILVMVVVYAATVQLRQLRGARAGAQLASAVAAQDEGDASSARAAAADGAQLRRRFEEAVDALKRSRRKGLASLYELPWYIIIGPPGSGKTTVLVNSGLNFPLAQKFGKEALRGVGGTRNCDWWFTDEAILLDTAGRYTTQDSDARADAAGWATFLQLLSKYRRRQPINGVIVAVSAADLLAAGEAEMQRHAVAIRERLEELRRNVRINVPVYFLLTKCDLIAGFSEFFDELGQDARAQVWGTTFAIELTESGRAAGAFGREFDRLVGFRRARAIARCLFHQRHAGRHADRPHPRRGGAHLRIRGGGRRAASRAGQGLFHRAAAASGHLPGIGPRGRQPASAVAEDRPAIGRLCSVCRAGDSRRDDAECELQRQRELCR
jgi:type VI secretion system protein ImpL